MYELIKIIIGWIILISIIIIIKNIIKEKQIKEQLKTKELQEYYKRQEKMKYNNEPKQNIPYSPYKINNNIFTTAEKNFYKILRQIIKEMNLTILAKVRLADIISTNNYKYFNKIKAKHIDFVLIDKDGNIKLLIELDDKSHENITRKERDIFLNKIFENQKIKLLRIPVKYSYNIKELENTIKESL